MKPIDHAKAFDAALLGLRGKHSIWQLFADFCELSSTAVVNQLLQSDELEQRYCGIAKRYDADEMKVMAHALAHVALGLQAPEPPDFLGAAFSRLELNSHWHGQFFTPIHIARCMAQMSLGDMGDANASAARAAIAERGYIRVHEPACGAGAMVIGVASALREAGFDPARQLHVIAVDLDPTAARMCHVQLSLLGIPALVYTGDSLTGEMRECFPTPAHVVGGWHARLSQPLESQAGAAPCATPRRADRARRRRRSDRN